MKIGYDGDGQFFYGVYRLFCTGVSDSKSVAYVLKYWLQLEL